ncbi:glycosyltransferase [Ruminococcus albus]|uniref:Glycosyltransferase involved in cell wall bisynthesis n=1 Tax=Ruminococcus albus TaxID=1264 RepID=A0A1I1D0G0_RUMAL|nr:glycosyltransferase [Ruminococcus albus]SFB66290.1 Glycosyltransferase involved in cell wall bisynthesis [Ruminococcus albus]
MKVVIYDVSAEDKGGLFVLNDLYSSIIKNNDDIEWHLFVSSKEFKSCNNIIVHYFPKMSMVKRLLFEQILINKEVNKISPDYVLSLQNIPLIFSKYRQLVYLHQSLQYCPVRFSFFRRSERSLAIRQHIICNIYRLCLLRADHIYVQTDWIKKATRKWLSINEKKISVVPITISKNDVPDLEYIGMNSRCFFYPARAQQYKNHSVVIEAVKILKKSGIKDFEVVFTIDPTINEYASELQKKATQLPIKFVGDLPYEQVLEKYSRSILIFPSYLETCGLPLVEARVMNCVIIASNLPFSHEALAGYSNALFFNYNNARDLANHMRKILNKGYSYNKNNCKSFHKTQSLYSQLVVDINHNV